MGNKLADVIAFIKADNSELKSDMAEAENTIQSSGGRFGSVLQGVGMAVGMGVAGMAVDATGKIQAFTGEAIASASDLNETVSKSSVVFGDNSAAVMAWAQTSATALGQSKQGALDAASGFGNLFVSMGMSTGPASDMSMGLTQLASDLASFNNLDPTVALEKLRAGMLGQSEPLQSLGVNMTAASVTAKALEMGLAATADALTPAMLAQARYAIILDQTKTAQGDFARTSDGLANQQRIADAQWKDMTATIGQALLPVQLALIQSTNQFVQRVLPPLSEFITTRVVPAMEAIGNVIQTVVGPMIDAAMGWFTSLGDTMRTQTDGPFAYLQQWFEKTMPLIQTLVDNVTKALTGYWRDHGEQITAIVQTLLNALYIIWDTQLKTILDIITAFFQLLTGDWEGAGQTLKGIVERWWDVLKGAVQFVVDHVRDAWLSVDWGRLGQNIIDGILNGLRNAGQGLLDFIGGLVQDAIDGALGGLGGLGANALPTGNTGRSALAAATSGATGLTAAPITITINNYGADAATVGQASRSGVLAALRAVGYQ